MNILGLIPQSISRMLPVFLALVFGSDFVNLVVNHLHVADERPQDGRRYPSISWYRNSAALSAGKPEHFLSDSGIFPCGLSEGSGPGGGPGGTGVRGPQFPV